MPGISNRSLEDRRRDELTQAWLRGMGVPLPSGGPSALDAYGAYLGGRGAIPPSGTSGGAAAGYDPNQLFGGIPDPPMNTSGGTPRGSFTPTSFIPPGTQGGTPPLFGAPMNSQGGTPPTNFRSPSPSFVPPPVATPTRGGQIPLPPQRPQIFGPSAPNEDTSQFPGPNDRVPVPNFNDFEGPPVYGSPRGSNLIPVPPERPISQFGPPAFPPEGQQPTSEPAQSLPTGDGLDSRFRGSINDAVNLIPPVFDVNRPNTSLGDRSVGPEPQATTYGPEPVGRDNQFTGQTTDALNPIPNVFDVNRSYTSLGDPFVGPQDPRSAAPEFGRDFGEGPNTEPSTLFAPGNPTTLPFEPRFSNPTGEPRDLGSTPVPDLGNFGIDPSQSERGYMPAEGGTPQLFQTSSSSDQGQPYFGPTEPVPYLPTGAYGYMGGYDAQRQGQGDFSLPDTHTVQFPSRVTGYNTVFEPIHGGKGGDYGQPADAEFVWPDE